MTQHLWHLRSPARIKQLLGKLHPRKLTWIPKMMVSKRWLLLKYGNFCGIHVNFLGKLWFDLSPLGFCNCFSLSQWTLKKKGFELYLPYEIYVIPKKFKRLAIGQVRFFAIVFFMGRYTPRWLRQFCQLGCWMSSADIGWPGETFWRVWT